MNSQSDSVVLPDNNMFSLRLRRLLISGDSDTNKEDKPTPTTEDDYRVQIVSSSTRSNRTAMKKEYSRRGSTSGIFGRAKEPPSKRTPSSKELAVLATTASTDSKCTTERTQSICSIQPGPEKIVSKTRSHCSMVNSKHNSSRTKQTVETLDVDTPSPSVHSRSLPNGRSGRRRSLLSNDTSSSKTREWDPAIFVVDFAGQANKAPANLVSPSCARESPLSTNTHYFIPDSNHGQRSTYTLPKECSVQDGGLELLNGRTQIPLRRRSSLSGQIRMPALLTTSITKTPWNQNLFTVDCNSISDDRSDDHVLLIENKPTKQGEIMLGGRDLDDTEDPSMLLNADAVSVVTASTCSDLTMGDPTMIKLYDKNGCLRKDLLIAMENGRPTMRKQADAKFVKPKYITFRRKERLLL